MWSLRQPDADWALVSPYFLTCILNGMMPDYFSNGHMYPLPWMSVDKVFSSLTCNYVKNNIMLICYYLFLKYKSGVFSG